MSVEWLIAKYMSDLRRREPVNVGIIVRVDDQIETRFLGQRVDGTIDGRRARWAGSASNYKAWVEYWAHLLESAEGAESLADVVSDRPDSNYLLEFGGRRLVADNRPDIDLLADQLFALLVEADADRSTLSVEKLSEGALKRAGIREQVQPFHLERVIRDGLVDSVSFDYRYDNGAVNLMQRAALTTEDDRSWDVVHQLVYAFEAARSYTEDDRTTQTIALVKVRDPDSQLRQQLGVLGELAHIVDVSREERAAHELRELLHVDGMIA